MVETETKRPGRNEPCHCGSGKKYKHCCLEKDEEAARERAQHAEPPPPAPAADQEPAPRTPPRRREIDQPWKRTRQDTRPFKRISGPRKVGGG